MMCATADRSAAPSARGSLRAAPCGTALRLAKPAFLALPAPCSRRIFRKYRDLPGTAASTVAGDGRVIPRDRAGLAPARKSLNPMQNWRRRRDSNPRYALRAYNGLANRRLQPLGHVSCAPGYAEDCRGKQPRTRARPQKFAGRRRPQIAPAVAPSAATSLALASGLVRGEPVPRGALGRGDFRRRHIGGNLLA